MKKINQSFPKDRKSNSVIQNELCKGNGFAKNNIFFSHFNGISNYILTSNFIRSSEISVHDL